MKIPKYKQISIKELKKAVIKLLSNRNEIQVVYLYGSQVSKNNSEFSDIDIGIVLNGDFNPPPLYSAELSVLIEKYFDFKINVDLKILNDATPRFLFEILKNCIILYCKDETFKDGFEIRALSQYQEIKPLLDKYDKLFIERSLNEEN